MVCFRSRLVARGAGGVAQRAATEPVGLLVIQFGSPAHGSQSRSAIRTDLLMSAYLIVGGLVVASILPSRNVPVPSRPQPGCGFVESLVVESQESWVTGVLTRSP